MAESDLKAAQNLGSKMMGESVAIAFSGRGAAGSEALTTPATKFCVIPITSALRKVGDISAISKASEAVVTLSATTTLLVGDYVLFSNVAGMVEINGQIGIITAVDDDEITVGIDSSGFTTYTSGGNVQLCYQPLAFDANLPGDGHIYYNKFTLASLAPATPFFVAGGVYAVIASAIVVGANTHYQVLYVFTIETGSVADGALTAAKLGADAITADKIGDAAIGADQLGADAITADKVADGAIGADQLGADAITSAKIADGAIGADQLGADAITNAKIADDAIAAENIADGALTAAKLGADAITNAKIADNAIAAENIASSALAKAKFAADMTKYIFEATARHLAAGDHYIVVFRSALTGEWMSSGVSGVTMTVTAITKDGATEILTDQALAETATSSGIWFAAFTDEAEQIPAGSDLAIAVTFTIGGIEYTEVRVIRPTR